MSDTPAVKRVAIVMDEAGNIEVFADAGVEVITVCDFATDDRLYRMKSSPIPKGLLDGPVGHADDGSAANARAHRAVSEWEGKPRLEVVRDV